MANSVPVSMLKVFPNEAKQTKVQQMAILFMEKQVPYTKAARRITTLMILAHSDLLPMVHDDITQYNNGVYKLNINIE